MGRDRRRIREFLIGDFRLVVVVVVVGVGGVSLTASTTIVVV